MKTNIFTKIKQLGHYAALAVMTLTVMVSAQTDPTVGAKGKGQKAYTTPISSKEISLTITLPSNQTIKLTVQNGAMGKIFVHEKKTYAYALVPSVKDLNNKIVDVIVYRLKEDKDGNESVQERERIEAKGDVSIATRTKPSMLIRLVDINQQSGGSVETRKCAKNIPQIEFAKAEEIDCCVKACGAEACGSSARIDCPDGSFVECIDPPGGDRPPLQSLLSIPLLKGRRFIQCTTNGTLPL